MKFKYGQCFSLLVFFVFTIFYFNNVSAAIKPKDKTPGAFVASIYDQYKQRPDDNAVQPGALIDKAQIELYFEPTLAAVLLNDRLTADDAGDTTDLDGDPFIDGQDWELTNVKISVNLDNANRALATVYFNNFNKPTVIRLSLVRLEQGWRIYDVIWERNNADEKDYPKTLREFYKLK